MNWILSAIPSPLPLHERHVKSSFCDFTTFQKFHLDRWIGKLTEPQHYFWSILIFKYFWAYLVLWKKCCVSRIVTPIEWANGKKDEVILLLSVFFCDTLMLLNSAHTKCCTTLRKKSALFGTKTTALRQGTRHLMHAEINFYIFFCFFFWFV